MFLSAWRRLDNAIIPSVKQCSHALHQGRILASTILEVQASSQSAHGRGDRHGRGPVAGLPRACPGAPSTVGGSSPPTGGDQFISLPVPLGAAYRPSPHREDRHTREPPNVVNAVGLPFMTDSKLNTGVGVQRIKVPYQVLFGQEYLTHTGRSF